MMMMMINCFCGMVDWQKAFSLISSWDHCQILAIRNIWHAASRVESGKCGKEGEKLQKFEYLENEKSFLDEIKTFFIFFEGPSFVEKIKIW